MADLVGDILLLGGMVMLAAAAWMVSPAFALAFVGAVFIVVSVMIWNTRRRS